MPRQSRLDALNGVWALGPRAIVVDEASIGIVEALIGNAEHKETPGPRAVLAALVFE